jgi:hypothetical protein
MTLPSPEEIESALKELTNLRDLIFEDGATEKENERERKARQALLLAITILSALKSGELVGKEEVYKYQEDAAHREMENFTLENQFTKAKEEILKLVLDYVPHQYQKRLLEVLNVKR